jgi:hypothetical protein
MVERSLKGSENDCSPFRRASHALSDISSYEWLGAHSTRIGFPPGSQPGLQPTRMADKIFWALFL